MRKRIVLILIIAAAMGLVASLLVYRVLSQVAASAAGGGSEKIVVAAVNMRLADTVTAKHVKLVAYPKASIPSGALRSVQEAEGRVVRRREQLEITVAQHHAAVRRAGGSFGGHLRRERAEHEAERFEQVRAGLQIGHEVRNMVEAEVSRSGALLFCDAFRHSVVLDR